MGVETTTKGTKKYSKEEKLSILKEATEMGIKGVLDKYGLYPATYYYWKRKFDQMGSVGLDHGMSKKNLAKIRKLEKENAALKQLLVERELESKIKDEILKKKYPHLRKLI
jgi:putative transposase